jgi:predicted DNA repair protein MutK
MTKVAAKKTAGVLGDDLALNAEQVSGVKASRELPVVWQVAKGSAVNKLMLVPAALAISAIAPILITPLLMLGGTYLCYEGAEKLLHKFAPDHNDHAHREELKTALENPESDFRALEKDKIKGAIRTDFILSAEIIVISLGTVTDSSFAVRLGVLSAIAAIMTVGVYGLVALIVRLDDIGVALLASSSALSKKLGETILVFAPSLMKFLSVAGTAAMFLVGGGIVAHGVPFIEHFQQALFEGLSQSWTNIAGMLWNAAIGIALGIVVNGVVISVKAFRS